MEKTGNNWRDRKNFVKKPNRFYPLEIDYGQEEEAVSVAKPLSTANSKLVPAVQELVKMIFNIDAMKKTMKEFEVQSQFYCCSC